MTTPPVFYDMPEIVIRLDGGQGQYLKLATVLDLEPEHAPDEIKAIEPRLLDMMQTYLIELKPDDIKGTAGMYRVRQELLRRVNDRRARQHERHPVQDHHPAMTDSQTDTPPAGEPARYRSGREPGAGAPAAAAAGRAQFARRRRTAADARRRARAARQDPAGQPAPPRRRRHHRLHRSAGQPAHGRVPAAIAVAGAAVHRALRRDQRARAGGRRRRSRVLGRRAVPRRPAAAARRRGPTVRSRPSSARSPSAW